MRVTDKRDVDFTRYPHGFLNPPMKPTTQGQKRELEDHADPRAVIPAPAPATGAAFHNDWAGRVAGPDL